MRKLRNRWICIKSCCSSCLSTSVSNQTDGEGSESPWTGKNTLPVLKASQNSLCEKDSRLIINHKSMIDYGKSTMSVGPWGGQDGFRWDDGVHSGIRQLVIAHGAGIDSVRIEYDDKGISVWSEKHGGSGGLKTDKVKLGYPDEFLTSVHGHHGSIYEWGPVFVRSLTFESNKKTYGPFGIEQGTYFSFPMNGSKVVGFHGKCSWYLNAFGGYLEPLGGYQPSPSKSLVQPQFYVTSGTEQFGYSVVQGNIGNNYDVILAFRQKNEYGYYSPKNLSQENEYSYYSPNNLSRQSSESREFSDTESRDKVHSLPDVPNSIEKVLSKTDRSVITYGTWGGTGGTVFDDGVYTGVRQIHLSRNMEIVSIRVLYDQNGEAVWGSKNGGTGGFKTEKIVFDCPYEILTHITGTYGPAMKMGPTVVKSLTFHTTKDKHGPFGDPHGQQFTTNVKEGKIVGFHGRKGLFLDAIGVHVVEGKITPPIHLPTNTSLDQGDEVIQAKRNATLPVPTRPISYSSNQSEASEGKVIVPKYAPSYTSSQGEAAAADQAAKPHWSNKLAVARRGPMPATDELAAYRVVKEPAQCETGPWGGEGGRPWDDGVFSGIKQIYLTRKDAAICSIQIEYDRNGQSVWSVMHGGGGDAGGTTVSILLDDPHEVLTCISGFYGPIINGDYGPKVIKSLTFTTSRRKCGPYGEEFGTFFTSIRTEGKVVGFHGRSGMYLDAVGVHMQHWLGSSKQSKSSSLMRIFR